MASEVFVAREGGVNPINAVGGRKGSGISALRAEADRIRSSSGISLSDNARELRYGSREWDEATSEGAWRGYKTQDGRSFFLKYDGSMFYERKRR